MRVEFVYMLYMARSFKDPLHGESHSKGAEFFWRLASPLRLQHCKEALHKREGPSGKRPLEREETDLQQYV